MFYDFIYLARGFQMRPKVRSTLNVDLWYNLVNNDEPPQNKKKKKKKDRRKTITCTKNHCNWNRILKTYMYSE